MPWQPDGIWQVVYSSKQWETSPGEDRYRRALYTLWRRTSPYPSMTTFDAPSGETCTIRRIRTNTPLQALVTLNDPTLMEAAQHLARRSSQSGGSIAAERLDHIFRSVLSRPPSEREIDRLLELRDSAADELRQDRDSAMKLANYDQVLYTRERRVSLVDDTRGDAANWRYTTEQPGGQWRIRSSTTPTGLPARQHSDSRRVTAPTGPIPMRRASLPTGIRQSSGRVSSSS